MVEARKTTDTSRISATRNRENMWLNFGFNIIIPVILLTKGDDWFGLSPAVNLIIALAFPVSYGLWDFITRRKFNFISLLGFVSVLLTGGIGLLQLPSGWIAVKEAAIPLIIGLVVLISHYTPTPLVRFFLLNPEMVDVDKIEKKIEETQSQSQYRSLIKTSTWLVSGSFFLSAVLNYILAKMVITSPSGTAKFNAELGKMQGLSYIVIVVPSMIMLMAAMFLLFNGIRKLTHLPWESFIKGAEEEDPEKSG